MATPGGSAPKLWFDVGIKRYTTKGGSRGRQRSCGLMQESKDIQQGAAYLTQQPVVV